MALVLRSDSDYPLYPYKPARPLPYIFGVFILVLGIINVYQNYFKWKWRRFGFIMTWASTVWVAAFICRAVSEAQPYSINIYVAQYVLVIAGPPLYGAAETFILGRLMAYLPYHASIHPGRVITTFIILSAAVESISANGASTVSTSLQPLDLSRLYRGFDLLNAALLLQSFVEILFLTLTAQLHYRARKSGTFPRQVKVMVYILYTTSTMLLVRCIFRAAEGFSTKSCIQSGKSCGVTKHEAYLWVFEVANITLFVLALTIFTPGRYLPHSDLVFLDKTDGKTERLGPGFRKLDDRKYIYTLFDPFNIHGMITKGGNVVPFWDEPQPVFEGDRRTRSAQLHEVDRPENDADNKGMREDVRGTEVV